MKLSALIERLVDLANELGTDTRGPCDPEVRVAVNQHERPNVFTQHIVAGAHTTRSGSQIVYILSPDYCLVPYLPDQVIKELEWEKEG